MTEVTVGQAASLLQVHETRVRALLSSGALKGRRLGNQWLIDTAALEDRRDLALAGAKSRALSVRSCWGAGALADGLDADWLASSERSRLRARLRTAHKRQVFQRWMASRHSDVLYLRCGTSDLQNLVQATGAVATGARAAATWGVNLAAAGTAELYVTRSTAQRVIDEFFLLRADRASRSTNVTLHVVTGDWHLRTAQERAGLLTAPRLLIATDLAEAADARSISAGQDLFDAVRQDLHQPTATRRTSVTQAPQRPGTASEATRSTHANVRSVSAARGM